MSVGEPFLLDEGYHEGIYYVIYDMVLCYTKLYKLYFNGEETYHRDDVSIRDELSKCRLTSMMDEPDWFEDYGLIVFED